MLRRSDARTFHRVEKIFLPEVTEFGSHLARDGWKVIYDQPDLGRPGDRQDGLRHAANLIRRGSFGAELDEVRASITKLAGDVLRRAGVEIGRINKGVE